MADSAMLQVRFRRDGGFANIPLSVELDADKLPPKEADELRQLIKKSDFFNLRSTAGRPTTGADQFIYSITAITSGKMHTIRVGNGNASKELQGLIQFLTERAKATRNK